MHSSPTPLPTAFPSPFTAAHARLWWRTAQARAGLLLLALACVSAPGNAQPGPAGTPPPGAADKQDYSAAERLLFMTPQLANVKPPQTLRYTLRKSGSFEPGYEDKAAVMLTAQPDGSCCAARSEFMSGERRMNVPEVPSADSNPVILYFLEREIREMQRLTKGAPNHFRQRIRMTVYQGATVSDVTVRWRGQAVAAKEIRFQPYLDDPNRQRFAKFALKEYRFILSPSVPGGVYAIRTRIEAEDPSAAPLIIEDLVIDGGELSATAPTPRP